jgi:preprotein translocase SecE subunit
VAEEKSKKRALKKPETLRERTERTASIEPKTRRLRQAASGLRRPVGAARRVGKKEYYLPLPDNRIGRFLNKRRSVTPRFLKEAWAELRQVEWPNARTTMRLTLAVFIFSLVFGAVITIVDYGLDKIFRKVFL